MTDRISTDELRRLLENATTGPWVFDGNRVKASGRTVSDLRYKNGGNDGLLIAASPELAAEVIRLREAALTLRNAQRAYMANRGNDELGRSVGIAADALDAALNNKETDNGTS